MVARPLTTMEQPNHSQPPNSPALPAVVTEPVYRQLTRVCRDALRQGDFKPGEQFPSERELAAQYGVSRATANKVISNLVAEGLLRFRKGIGTFVREPSRSLHTSLREMESFTQHAQALGMKPETRILAFEKVAARDLPADVATGLRLDPTAKQGAMYFERLRLADGEPVILEQRWLLASLVPGLRKRELAGSLYALLEERFQVTLAGERHVIRARALDSREADLLQTPDAMPALVVEGPGFDQEREPVWYQVLVYRADKYQLVNEVTTSSRNVTRSQVHILPAA